MTMKPIITGFPLLKDIGIFEEHRGVASRSIFQKFNLIYGSNGSGKTTLSRLFASLEMGKVHPNISGVGKFQVELSSGTKITNSSNLDSLKGRILVFNVDFIDKNLYWKDSRADPIFYLGEDQKHLVKELERAQKDLDHGLNKLQDANKRNRQTDKEFAEFKQSKARNISGELNLGRTYNAPNLSADYTGLTYRESSRLGDEKVEQLCRIFAQGEAQPTVTKLNEPSFSLAKCAEEMSLILGQTLGNLRLQELQEHPEMLSWVRKGSDFHSQQDQTHCLLCGSEINGDRLLSLDQALVDASYDALMTSIEMAIDSCRSSIDYLQSLRETTLEVNACVASHLADQFNSEANKLEDLCKLGKMALQERISLLEKKRSSLTTKANAETLGSQEDARSWDEKFLQGTLSINTVIQEHNQSQTELSRNKEEAKCSLKAHWLAEGQEEYSHLYDQNVKAQETVEKLEKERNALEQETEQIRQAIRQHKPAANKINQMLSAYLGHDTLQFVTDQEDYRIAQNGDIVTASTISEGEKTAIAFCYFLTTLAANNRDLEDLIVVVDDPVSSLDTKALHHVVGLLRSHLNKVSQLIVMTHNLDFMNDMKKWVKYKTKKNTTGKITDWPLLYLEVRDQSSTKERTSSIKEMPKLLQNFDSEYQYLFSLVNRFDREEENIEDFAYLMPNAIRKVLEIFLSYRLPVGGNLNDGIQTIIQRYKTLDSARIRALERVANLESHANNPDALTSLSSITLEETKEAARTLLELMNIADEEHLKEMRKLSRK